MAGVAIGAIKGLGKPMGLTLDPQGRLLVTDIGHKKIFIYNEQISLVGELGNLNLEGPHSVLFDKNQNIYIFEYRSQKILKLNPDGTYLKTIVDGKNLPTPFAHLGPCVGTFDPDGHLIVCAFLSDSLMKFTSDGEFLGWLGFDKKNQKLSRWELLGEPGHSIVGGGFNRPNAITFDDENNFYVADMFNHRIQKFGQDGDFVGWLGKARDEFEGSDLGFRKLGESYPAQHPGAMMFPTSVRFARGELFISEFGNDRIQRFSKSGKFLGWFGGQTNFKTSGAWIQDGFSLPGQELGCFTKPYDVLVTDEWIAVADTYNGRVQLIKI